MIQIIFFVPDNYKEKVKHEMFKAGGGKIGNYDSCCFENQGIGQFRALVGSDPFIGKLNVLETVNEVRVEMSCEDHLFEAVIQALKDSHPYETPAYYRIKTLS